MQSTSDTSKGWWPHVRAAFVAFHLLAITLDASPSPGAGMSRAAWKDPTVQAEFGRWAGILGMDSATLEAQLWDTATTFTETRRTVMTPFWPYLEATGTSQAWQMFVAPHRFPTRMQLQVHRSGHDHDDYQTIFEERSDVFTWRQARFNSERLRAAIFRWGWPNYQKAWQAACKVFARELMAEDAEIDVLRCRMFKQRSPSPEEFIQNTADPGDWVFVQIVKSTELNP